VINLEWILYYIYITYIDIHHKRMFYRQYYFGFLMYNIYVTGTIFWAAPSSESLHSST